MGPVEYLWSLLPDKCARRGYGCLRRGVRGNENLIDGEILCDDCTVLEQRKKERDLRRHKSTVWREGK